MVCDINSEVSSVSEAARETHSSHIHMQRVTNTYFPKKRACTSPLQHRALFYSLQSAQAHILRWISAGHHGNQWGYSPSLCLREGGKVRELINNTHFHSAFTNGRAVHTKYFIHLHRSVQFWCRDEKRFLTEEKK